jgi:hypothetical protein
LVRAESAGRFEEKRNAVTSKLLILPFPISLLRSPIFDLQSSSGSTALLEVFADLIFCRLSWPQYSPLPLPESRRDLMEGQLAI